MAAFLRGAGLDDAALADPEKTMERIGAAMRAAVSGLRKTLMARGLCQSRAGQLAEAEQSFLKAYEMDAANPVVAYQLSSLLLRRNELTRAQF